MIKELKEIYKDFKTQLLCSIVIFIISMNSFFWFEQSSYMDTIKIDLDYANISTINFWIVGILTFLLLECIFITILLLKKKKLYESWSTYVSANKLKALFYASSIFWLFTPGIIYLNRAKNYLIKNWVIISNKITEFMMPIIIMGIIIGSVLLVWYCNYLLAKLIGSEEKRKFKPGQKIKLKSLYSFHNYGGIYLSYGAVKKFEGKKVTIHKYIKDNQLKIKEDQGKNIWTEEMFYDI